MGNRKKRHRVSPHKELKQKPLVNRTVAPVMAAQPVSSENEPPASWGDLGSVLLGILRTPLALVASLVWFLNAALFTGTEERVRNKVRNQEPGSPRAATTFFRMFGKLRGYQDYLSRLAARTNEQRWVSKVVIGHVTAFEVTLSIPVQVGWWSVRWTGPPLFRVVAGTLVHSKLNPADKGKAPDEFKDDPTGLQLLVRQETWAQLTADTGSPSEEDAQVKKLRDALRKHRASTY